MEQSLIKRDIYTTQVNPGQKIEVAWFERDGTYSGIGVVHNVSPSTIKVILEKVLSGGSSYKAGQEVKIQRSPECTEQASLNSIRLIEEKTFIHKDFL